MKPLPLFFLLFLFSFMSLVSGCGPSLAKPTPISTSTPLPTLRPTCIPTPSDFYSNNGSTNKQATDLADKIYGQLFIGALGSNDLVGMKEARTRHYNFLLMKSNAGPLFQMKSLLKMAAKHAFSSHSSARS